MSSDILEIRMQSNEIDCAICGEPDDFAWGVPTYNGDIVSNDFPDDLYARTGGSMAVCRRCHEKHERGEIEVFDHYYYTPLRGFIDGAGI
jgi:hypothetical protein